jgi:diguanylate cyclase
VSITLSCGLTQLQEGDTPGQVFERADQAMYRAKSQGRNRCLTG